LPPNPIHHAAKHRYLSIDPATNEGEEAALKVELASMKRCSGDLRRACNTDADCRRVCANNPDITCSWPAQCGGDPCVPTEPCIEHPDVGLTWWVQEPEQVPEGCLPDNDCGDEDWIARLDTAAYSRVWTLNTLHVGDCAVVPAATYLFYACDPLTPDICTYPLTIATQPMPLVAPTTPGGYGDVTGGATLPGPEVIPPDGYVNSKDLQVTLLTILNYGTTNKPQTHPTWVDLHGLETGSRPNYILNVSDLQQVSFGLFAHPWTQDPGNLQPGQCP
jgi:hypothetical protein